MHDVEAKNNPTWSIDELKLMFAGRVKMMVSFINYDSLDLAFRYQTMNELLDIRYEISDSLRYEIWDMKFKMRFEIWYNIWDINFRYKKWNVRNKLWDLRLYEIWDLRYKIWDLIWFKKI